MKITKRIIAGTLLSGVAAMVGFGLTSATAQAAPSHLPTGCYMSSDPYGGMNCYYDGPSMLD
jgi:hypothetical protein